MTDIAKCQNEECPSKDMCYRYTAPSGEWQAYCDFKVKKGKDKCDSWWPNDVKSIHPVSTKL